MKQSRINKEAYYLNIAESILERSTCLRRQYGAVIVRNDEIIATGYNGSPRGCYNCNEIGKCIREEQNIPQGQRYELCRSVHAEANAIISAARKDMIGATLFLAGWDCKGNEYITNAEPCSMCKRLILNAGIAKVITRCNSGVIHITDTNDYAVEI